MKLLAFLWLAALLQRTVVKANSSCHSMQLALNLICNTGDQNAETQQQIVEGKRGKAGPQGPPGKVNYTLVDENIKERYRAFEQRFSLESERQIGMHSTEIKLLKNKITELESRWQKRFNSLLTGCEKVSKYGALSWNGTGGIFNIYPDNPQESIEVYCDLTSDGGGWIVFQRRMDGSVDFYRGWNEYVNGFGENDKEFWLGLETIHQLTKNGNYELRVDIGDWEGERRYAQYGTFSISGSNDNYRLTVGDYSGTAGDSLIGHHNGQQFSTKDQDNDGNSGNCAVSYTGAWWYQSCYNSNLNGVYHVGGTGANDKNIAWWQWKNTHNYSYKFTEIKFRKKQN
uniref:Ficolin 4 n=1 Tax=Halocynthia roretzi TaxID=7729 RepID=Q966W1_HALRO|nr:ficolin 4 [Halocynthia roretzi]